MGSGETRMGELVGKDLESSELYGRILDSRGVGQGH